MKNSKTLQNLKILITRPLTQAQSLAAAITEQGGIPILFPTIEIIPYVDKVLLSQVMQQLSKSDFVIFASVNAVAPIISFWPQPLLPLRIIAIGPATAKATVQLSKSVIFPSQHNSETLLNLPDLQKVKGKRIIIFSGVGGRTLIADSLRQRGAEVIEAKVYRRVLPRLDIAPYLQQWQKNDLDIIICTSQECLRNLVTSVGTNGHDWLLQRQLLVISQRMLIYAQELGFTRLPILAENAGDKAILTALKAWYASRFC